MENTSFQLSTNGGKDWKEIKIPAPSERLPFFEAVSEAGKNKFQLIDKVGGHMVFVNWLLGQSLILDTSDEEAKDYKVGTFYEINR